MEIERIGLLMKKRMLITLCALLVLFAIGSYAAQPGTDADPLITKSYIDSVVYPTMSFKVVEVKAGHSLVAQAGTEMILRMGSCTVIGTQKGGLSDVTMGFDLADGIVVQGNHHLICPIGDGRGLKTSTDCLIMVKGGYEIK